MCDFCGATLATPPSSSSDTLRSLELLREWGYSVELSNERLKFASGNESFSYYCFSRDLYVFANVTRLVSVDFDAWARDVHGFLPKHSDHLGDLRVLEQIVNERITGVKLFWEDKNPNLAHFVTSFSVPKDELATNISYSIILLRHEHDLALTWGESREPLMSTHIRGRVRAKCKTCGSIEWNCRCGAF